MRSRSSETGRLVFVGDGPLRGELEGRANVEITGRVPHEDVSRYIAESTVLCQPSLIEPFGQALLEGMAVGRSVVATRVGGPPEFVPPEAGILVDPLDTAALADAMRRAAELPTPNPAAREAAAAHDVRRSGGEDRVDSGESRSRSASLTSTSGRIRSSSPASCGEPQRRLVALPRLFGRDALLQPVVAGHEELLDLLARRVGHAKKRSFGRIGVDRAEMEAADAPRARPVRVLIADDERLFVESVEALLADDERVEVDRDREQRPGRRRPRARARPGRDADGHLDARARRDRGGAGASGSSFRTRAS